MDKLSRRTFLKGSAAAAGVAGVAATTSIVPGALGTAAQAAGSHAHPADRARGGPVVAHLRDARTGEFSLFVGTREIRFRDPSLASRLLHKAD